MDIFCGNYLKPLMVLSSGIFAGLGVTLSLVAVPALLGSNDPVPIWAKVYKKGAQIALTCIGVTCLSSLLCYFYGNAEVQRGCLFILGITALVPVYTIVFIKPINDVLLKEKKDSKEGRQLIKKWEGHQWVRTTLGLASFALSIYNH